MFRFATAWMAIVLATCLASSLHAQNETTSFQPLIVGDSLEGWYFFEKPARPNWVVTDGELVCLGSGPALVSDGEYDDFLLKFEFYLPNDCNTGIFLRGRYELKLTDSPGSGSELPPTSRCGAIYKQIAPTKNMYLGAGKWNSVVVKLVENKVSVMLNDVVVVKDEEIQKPTNPSLSKFQNEGEPGPLMLNCHTANAGLRYRNLEIQRLD